MESSTLPLSKWFSAIHALSNDMTISLARLQEISNITRLATARKLHKKIVAALQSADADRLLAGLNRPHAFADSLRRAHVIVPILQNEVRRPRRKAK